MKFDMTAEDFDIFDAKMREAHALYTKEIMQPIVHIYVDLPLLIDYRLGTILYLYHNQPDAFEYIQTILQTEYNVLIGKNISEKFPRLPLTDEEILEVMQQPSVIDIITKLSPLTTVHDHFFLFAEDIYHNNVRFNSLDTSRLKIYINNPYFETPERVKEYIKYNLLRNTACDLFFICDPDYMLDEINICDFLFIDNLTQFNISPLVMEMFKAQFVEKTICAAFITEGNVRLDEDDTGTFFKEVHQMMNVCTDFKFIHKLIPIIQTSEDKPKE